MKTISFLFNLLFFLVPLAFFPGSSEIFEFNKIILVYIGTILIAATWAIASVSKKKFIFKKNALTVPIIIFLISQILATVFSIDVHTSIFGYYSRFNGGLLSSICYAILYFAYVTFMDKKATLGLLKTVMISMGIVAIYAALEHTGHSVSCVLISGKFDAACWVQKVQERVFGTMGQPNWLAAVLVATAPVAWAMAIINQKKKRLNYLYLALSALFFITLLFTKSRSGLLGFGAAFVVFWTGMFYENQKNIKKIFLLIASFCLLATIFIWNPIAADKTPPTPGVTPSSGIRELVWKGAMDLWARYPLTGTGVETFGYAYWSVRPAAHNLTSEWNFIYNKAHNEYLNYAATTGTIGLAAYLLLIFTSLKIFFVNRKNIWAVAFGSGYVSILVTNFFGFSVVTTSLLFFVLPAMAISLSSRKQNTKLKLKLSNKLFTIPIIMVTGYLLARALIYWSADFLYARGGITNTEFAVLLNPNEAVYHTQLAEEYAKDKEQIPAYNEARAAEALSPRNVKVLKQVAGVYSDLAQSNRSFLVNENEILLRLTKLAPTDAYVYYQLSLSYAKMEKMDKAQETLAKTLELKPDYKLAQQLQKYLF